MSGSFSARAWSSVGFIGVAGVSVMGIAAVDCALWDLRGKQAGMNVAHLIGAAATSVPVYASGGLWRSLSIDAVQKQAALHLKNGYRAMKVRIGADPDDAVARVKAVREVIGPDVALMADPHQAFGVAAAIRLGRMLEEFNLTWFEEPTSPEDHGGEAAIAAALDTPIASGESVYTSRGIHAMLQQRSADILMPDHLSRIHAVVRSDLPGRARARRRRAGRGAGSAGLGIRFRQRRRQAAENLIAFVVTWFVVTWYRATWYVVIGQ